MTTATATPIRTKQATTGTRFLHTYGVTLAMVAREQDVHHTAVSRYFMGTLAPPPEFLAALRKLLPDDATADHAFSLCPRAQLPAEPQSTAPATLALHARGLSLADLARDMVPPQETMSRWVNGHRAAPAELRTALHRLLGDDAPAVMASIRWRDR